MKYKIDFLTVSSQLEQILGQFLKSLIKNYKKFELNFSKLIQNLVKLTKLFSI